MAYVTAQLNLMIPHVGDGPGWWNLVGTDVHTDVDAADFFTDGDDKGMRVGDTVIVHDSTTPFGVTLHRVTVVTAGGAASIGAALLA
jgi:hypothetical protein